MAFEIKNPFGATWATGVSGKNAVAPVAPTDRLYVDPNDPERPEAPVNGGNYTGAGTGTAIGGISLDDEAMGYVEPGLLAAGQLVAAELNQALAELFYARRGLKERIAEVEVDRARETQQALDAITLERSQLEFEIAAVAAEGIIQRDQRGGLHNLAVGEFIRQQGDLEEAKVLATADFARQAKDLEANRTLGQEDLARLSLELQTRGRLALEAIDRQSADLTENRDAAVAEITRNLAELVATRDNSLTGIRARAAYGEAEAVRKIGEMQANEEQILRQITDRTTLELNRATSQARFEVTRAEEGATIAKGAAVARAAGSNLRRAGTPLMALRQQERAASEEIEQIRKTGEYGLRSTLLTATQQMGATRLQAQQAIAGIRGEKAGEDLALRLEQSRIELQFEQTSAGIEATRLDLFRQHRQQSAAFAAEREASVEQQAQGQAGLSAEGRTLLETTSQKLAEVASRRAGSELGFSQTADQIRAQSQAEQTVFGFDIANLRQSAAEAMRGLQDKLKTSVLENRQMTEDIQAESDVLTAQYRRNIAESLRKRNYIASVGSQLVTNANWGQVATILGTVLDVGSFVAGL